MRTLWLWCSVMALASGCIVPRSMMIGQMAAPTGRGATDVGVQTGFIYASQTNPQFNQQDPVTGDPFKTNEKTAGFTIPAFEANLNAGFSEHVSLNVHASSAGLQPGLKLTLNKSKVAHVALMPQVAFGYASLGAQTQVAGVDGVLVDTAPKTQTSFTFLGGLKFLFSHRSGFYAGVGYDFVFNRNYTAAIVGGTGVTDKSETVISTTGHAITASVGIDITLGWVHLRPEVAFQVTPGIAQNLSTRTGADFSAPVGATGGGGWALMPGFTIAIQTPRRELTEEEQQEEEEAEKAAAKKKKRSGQEEEEEEDDDEDESPKRPAGKKKAKLDDDEEEENPRGKKRRQVEDDDN